MIQPWTWQPGDHPKGMRLFVSDISIDPLHTHHLLRLMPRSPCWWSIGLRVNAASPKMRTSLNNTRWLWPPKWRIQDYSDDDVMWIGSINHKGKLTGFFILDAGISSFAVVSQFAVTRGFGLDGNEHPEAMVPIAGKCMSPPPPPMNTLKEVDTIGYYSK